MDGIGQQFVEMTKYHKMGRSDYGKGVVHPSVELEWDRSKALLPLPAVKNAPAGGTPLRQAIEQRRSLREYAELPISEDELSFLLWCSQGIQRLHPGSRTERNVPSAGARHAFETLVLANRVAGIPPGLYRYVATRHALVEDNLSSGIADRVTEACLGQDFVRRSGATFIWVAIAYRMTYRYGERGYRYLYLDAGHVCQNLYLAAEAIGCGACALAAFSDDDLNRVLRLDGREQFAIYLGTVGKKP